MNNMKNKKGFVYFEFTLCLLKMIFVIFIPLYFTCFYKQQSNQYEGKIQYEKYFNNEKQLCSIRIENVQIDNVPVEKCLFLNNEKEYILITNGFFIEIQEKN